MHLMNEQVHQCKVAKDRYEAVGKMEPHEWSKSPGVIAPIAPRVADMPCEVMQQSNFYRYCRCVQIMTWDNAIKDSQRCKLNRRSHGSDQIKFPITNE
jgi:hypothetical protein